MTIEPINPVATPAVTVAALLADLDLTREPRPGEAIHPYDPDDGELLAIQDHLADLLGWRRPETPAEALAMLALAYTQLDIERSTDDPPKKARIERAFRLVYAALPVLAGAIPTDGVPAAVIRHFGAPAVPRA